MYITNNKTRNGESFKSLRIIFFFYKVQQIPKIFRNLQKFELKMSVIKIGHNDIM